MNIPARIATVISNTTMWVSALMLVLSCSPIFAMKLATGSSKRLLLNYSIGNFVKSSLPTIKSQIRKKKSEVCPHNKCGEVRGCSLTCHCPDHDTCNPVNCDCGRKLCHKDYRGAGCQDRLPQLARSPTVSWVKCNTVKVQWNAYNMEVDVGSHPEVGRYDIYAGLHKHTENGWIKLKEVPFARGVTRYSEEVSKGMAPHACYFFRVDVVGFEDEKLWSEITPGKHTRTSTCNRCSKAKNAWHALCPPNKCGSNRNCDAYCHCADGVRCNQRNCDCAHGLCDKLHRGSGCHERLPELKKSPTVSYVECNTVKLEWDAWDYYTDVGFRATVGRYDIHAGLKSDTDSGWTKLKSVLNNPAVTRYSEEVSRGLKPNSCYFFRVDVVGIEDGKYWKVSAGKHTPTSVCNKCAETSGRKNASGAEHPRHASLVELLVGAILTWAVGRVASGHGK